MKPVIKKSAKYSVKRKIWKGLVTGITKMKESMLNHGLDEPEFLEEGDTFVVKFYGPEDNILDLVSSIPEERVIDLKELKLKDIQIQALKVNG